MKAFFLSDLHLKEGREQKSLALLAFLESENLQDATHLFFVGDIFDLWISKHEFFVQEFRDLIAVLEGLHHRGVEIHFFEGNHDLFLEPYFRDVLGFQVWRAPHYFNLGPFRVRVEHGDLLNPNDKGYLFLKWLLHSKPVETLAHRLPGRLVNSLGKRMSKASRQYTSTSKAVRYEAIRQFSLEYARNANAKEGFDLMICGHVHQVMDETLQFENKSFRFINLGDWSKEFRVFSLDERQGQWVTLSST